MYIAVSFYVYTRPIGVSRRPRPTTVAVSFYGIIGLLPSEKVAAKPTDEAFYLCAEGTPNLLPLHYYFLPAKKSPAAGSEIFNFPFSIFNYKTVAVSLYDKF